MFMSKKNTTLALLSSLILTFSLCFSSPIQAQLLEGVKRSDWDNYKPVFAYAVGEANCFELPQGINDTDSDPEIASVDYKTSTDGTSLFEHIVFTNGEEGMVYYFRSGDECKAWKNKIIEVQRADSPYGYALNDYTRKLEKQYSERIQFEDETAKYLVNNFKLDCRMEDHRYVPLRSILLTKLAQVDSPGMWMTIRAVSRGDELRLYDVLHKDGQPVMEIAALQLTKWGELESLNGKMEGIMSSCSGVHGPIWISGSKN